MELGNVMLIGVGIIIVGGVVYLYKEDRNNEKHEFYPIVESEFLYIPKPLPWIQENRIREIKELYEPGTVLQYKDVYTGYIKIIQKMNDEIIEKNGNKFKCLKYKYSIFDPNLAKDRKIFINKLEKLEINNNLNIENFNYKKLEILVEKNINNINVEEKRETISSLEKLANDFEKMPLVGQMVTIVKIINDLIEIYKEIKENDRYE